MPLLAIRDIAVIHRQRGVIDPGKLSELAKSIEANGLLHPIVVRRPFEHEQEECAGLPFVLAVGGRRLAAHILLGRDSIEANIKEDLDSLSAEVVELEENLQRENITWQEEISARARIHELRLAANPLQRLSDTAAELGIDAGNLSRDISLVKAIASDPALGEAKSAHSARRKVAFKEEISTRIRTAEKNTKNLGDIKQRLFIGDARTFIRNLPSKSIDLVLTDFPYGGIVEKVNATAGAASEYDDSEEASKDLIADLAPEIARVIKPTGWIACTMSFSGYPFLAESFQLSCTTHGGALVEGKAICDKRPAGVDSPPCVYLEPEEPAWMWHKPNVNNKGHWPERHAMNAYEMICVVNGGKAVLAQPGCPNVLVHDVEYSDRLHINQKPLALGRDIVMRLTTIGETVLDLCFGSGAFLAAAASAGRNYLGCELNPAMLEPALTLVAQHQHSKIAVVK